MKTTVKWFNVAKGYGFLDNGAGPDIYVNAKSLRGIDRVSTGDLVEFECHVFDGKLVARHVKPVRSGQNGGGQSFGSGFNNGSYGNSSHGNQGNYGRDSYGGNSRFGSDSAGNRQEYRPRSQHPRFIMQ
jgi:cold shock CspA family protein